MFESIAQQITTTAITLGSLLFGSVVGTNATFDTPRISVNGSKIVISAELVNCYTEELDKIFQSGKPVRIYFRVSLHEGKTNNPVLVRDFYHQVRYSLVDKYYDVYFSEHDVNRTALTTGEVHEHLSTIDQYEVIEADNLRPGTEYYIKITAFMKDIRLPGINEDISLMSYWKGREPQLKSESFEKSVLAL